METKVFRFARPGQTVFTEEFSYENFYNMVTDLRSNRLTKEEAEVANETIREELLKIFGLTKEEAQTKRVLLDRQIRHNAELFFEIISDVVNEMISEGFGDNPFFEMFVEQKNVADGNDIEFEVNEDDQYLSIAEVAPDHHDISLQRLRKGRSFPVGGKRYGAAVGTNIRQYLLGKVDFISFINVLYRSFEQEIKNQTYATLKGVADQIPMSSQFHLNIQLTAATKDQFDDLIDLVNGLSGGQGVYILCTRKGASKLESVLDMDWVSGDMKNEKYRTGRLQFYSGTPVIEIPQRYEVNKNVATGLYDDSEIFILPRTEDKFIKFVNYGEPHTRQVMEDGAYQDDIISFEYTEKFGIAAVFSKVMGVVTLAG